MINARSAPNQILGLAGWLLLSIAAGAVGAVASIRAAEFYQGLVRPEWAPPASVFGPVWSCLYFLMGVAAWLVWRERGVGGAKAALSLFIAQLVANALWSWLFFAWHRGRAASVEIVILWLLIVGTTVRFWRVRPLAAVLLLPYLGWVTFAIALCWTTWRLNPTQLGN